MLANKDTPLTEDQKMRSDYRAYLVVIIWSIVVLVILGRVFYVQVISHEYYASLGDKQYVSSSGNTFERGSIFFSQYRKDPVPAAQLRSTYRIAIDPIQIVDKEGVYEILARYFPLDKTAFIERASKEDDPYEEIAKDISPETVAEIRKEKIKGLTFVKENKRAYPQESIGAKVVGFVGNDGVKIKGQYGLERYYEDVLARTGAYQNINFFAELFADIEQTTVSNIDGREGDILLTVDVEAERALHAILEETKKEWSSDTIGGIVMDQKTGAIVAMDALPSYDPNIYAQVEDASFFSNQNISGVYEMGSIIKPLTVAAALDAGVVTEDTTYTDTGFRDLNGYKVRNYDGQARGPNTHIQTILDKSLNVGIVFLVEKLGIKTFQDYFKKFGIGDETGIDLPQEASGLTKNLDSSVFVDSATAGFGQGIAITPIQTIRALGVLGNGGYLVSPHIVDSILYQDGTVKKIVQDPSPQVISREASETITRMLVHVVDTALKNGTYKMDRYSIAAKTGTAQIPKPGGGYYDDRYLHSFFGYFPAYEPRYIIFLYHTYPKGAEYASATLTDPFFKMVKFLISYYEIPPDR